MEFLFLKILVSLLVCQAQQCYVVVLKFVFVSVPPFSKAVCMHKGLYKVRSRDESFSSVLEELSFHASTAERK